MSDYRAYPTQAGQHFEALAKSMGYPIQVAWVVIGKGILPDDQSPYLQTKLLSEIKRFPAAVRRDENNPGIWIAECAIPADDNIDGKGYVINEMGLELGLQGKGILYAYRRVAGDVKQVIADGAATSIFYRIQFIPSKDAIVNATIDPTIVWASQEQLQAVMEQHKQDPDAHPELTTVATGSMTASGTHCFYAAGTLTLLSAAELGSTVRIRLDYGVPSDAVCLLVVDDQSTISTRLGADKQIRLAEKSREYIAVKTATGWRVS